MWSDVQLFGRQSEHDSSIPVTPHNHIFALWMAHITNVQIQKYKNTKIQNNEYKKNTNTPMQRTQVYMSQRSSTSLPFVWQ